MPEINPAQLLAAKVRADQLDRDLEYHLEEKAKLQEQIELLQYVLDCKTAANAVVWDYINANDLWGDLMQHAAEGDAAGKRWELH